MWHGSKCQVEYFHFHQVQELEHSLLEIHMRDKIDLERAILCIMESSGLKMASVVIVISTVWLLLIS